MNKTELPEDEVIVTQRGEEFTVGEIKNSKRIQKSATPKGTLDWYIKWFASALLILAVAFRSAVDTHPELHIYDMVFSFLGILGWLSVGIMWKDRALIILNSVMGFMLISGILKTIL